MSSPSCGQLNLVRTLATLLRNDGDSVLDGSSTLTLQVSCLQHLTRLFQQFLHSRTNQHGFLALASHPPDTPAMLQVQFLFDMLQKTISLKLINPPGVRLQSAVKIFPFKSLRYLELKRIPPHCLEGLRAVYSELQVFICSRSLCSLQELLSLCGGDLSSALPWLELHTLNFSYNSISCLDESLRLLNVLRSLDLSHNRIQTCGEFLQPLGDLQHLNLGYNFLQRVPVLAVSCRATLVKLVLRNNELETINGVEQLCSLQHLDLAYNLLMEHSQLAPLSLLHNLNTLQLEGNPLHFHKNHRLCAVRHISPKAAFRRLNLDGCLLSSCELEVLRRLGQVIGQMPPTMSQTAMATEKSPQEVSSGAGEMSDSLCLSEPPVKPLHKKKSKTKVRVRRASISEPSDTDHDLRTQSSLQDIVLHHQKDIERMETFRHQLGEDWLLYHHHLEKPREAGRSEPDHPGVVNGHCAAPPSESAGPPDQVSPPSQLEQNATPLLTSEPKQEWLEPEADTESTLRWPGHGVENTDSTLETSVGEIQLPGNGSTPLQKEEEEEELGVDLCLPLLVGVLSEGEEDQGMKTARGPLFLRVKSGHMLEVDMQSGRVLTKLELDSLREVTTSLAAWTEKEETRLPAVDLHFSYINRTRRQRRYVMLDENPEQMQQALADILFQAVEENKRRAPQGHQQIERMQCLKCCAEFCQQGAKQITGRDLGDQDESRQADGAGSALSCPVCGSDHVVQVADQLAPSTSTPVQGSSEEDDANRDYTFHDSSAQVHRLQDPALGEASLTTGSPAHMETGLSDTFLTARSHTFYIGDGDGSSLTDRSPPSQLAAFQTPSGPANEELYSSYNYTSTPDTKATPPLLAPHLNMEGTNFAPFDMISEDCEVVDHRLKLFLDVEVFESDSEEFRCHLKMSAVKFGNPVEFPSLLVVSDQSIYILEITMETQRQPSDVFLKRGGHRITELSYLELGLGSQSIHMEFEDGGSAYTLLVRDRPRCKHFFGLLTGIAKELAPKSNSKLKSISSTRLNPQHHLWSLLCDISQDVEHYQPQFLYVLAFIMSGGSLSPVTVLVTPETMYLLNEDHQWRKSLPDATPSEHPSSSGSVVVQETQPISCVSSVHLFACDPCRVNINIYDEVEKEERLWVLLSGSAELTQALVDWVRTRWEAMFGVRLMTSIQEAGS
ncbi:serine/threonine-protein kinase 11-interacting protein isoform X1 [Anguilla rostrata]|uniref:serine/threonine-protein kinase 11-interacting protein isoform X1 n=1 Tax=Anguilla rostrata TaxID=7938 RepID=UPI0030D1C46A